MERPALGRLMADIEAGRIDCVVVYKVDRLSRSLLDFARIMGSFEKHGVSFVSVTQQFNTSVPVGRPTLNILLSFAQFEREIISERTRDKKAASPARRGNGSVDTRPWVTTWTHTVAGWWSTRPKHSRFAPSSACSARRALSRQR